MLNIGHLAGYFSLHRWTRKWWEVRFPDGSFEIVRDEGRTQLEDAIITGAHKLWSERALKRMIKERDKPSDPG